MSLNAADTFTVNQALCSQEFTPAQQMVLQRMFAVGLSSKAATVSAASVPFADLTAAANSFNALLTSLKNAGIVA